MRGIVQGTIYPDGDVPAGCFPVCVTSLGLGLPARMAPMSEEASGMEMNGVFFMVCTLMNTDEHSLHRTLGQEGPCQEKHHKRGNGSSFHSIGSIFLSRAAGIAVHVVRTYRQTNSFQNHSTTIRFLVTKVNNQSG